MSEMMVRKQIYLHRRQNQVLKRLASQRGVSEAEVVRQAIEHEAKAVTYPARGDASGWNNVQQFVKERKAAYSGHGKPVEWDREDLYDGRGRSKSAPEK